MLDPAIDHVGQCSPRFAELTDMRCAIHRRKLLWAAGSAAASVVLGLLVMHYFVF